MGKFFLNEFKKTLGFKKHLAFFKKIKFFKNQKKGFQRQKTFSKRTFKKSFHMFKDLKNFTSPNSFTIDSNM